MCTILFSLFYSIQFVPYHFVIYAIKGHYFVSMYDNFFLLPQRRPPPHSHSIYCYKKLIVSSISMTVTSSSSETTTMVTTTVNTIITNAITTITVTTLFILFFHLSDTWSLCVITVNRLRKMRKPEEIEENDRRTNYVKINAIFLILLSKLAITQINLFCLPWTVDDIYTLT